MKTFKRLPALEKHTKSHNDDPFYTNQLVFSFVSKAMEMCISSGVHANTIVDAIKSYKIDENSISVLVKYLNSVKKNNVEMFYNKLFNDIIKSSGRYFSLPEKASKVICLKFVELLIASLNKKEIVENITIKNLTEKEVAGLQYLGGYVLRKIYMKLKLSEHNKLESNQQAMEILSTAKSTVQSPSPTYVEDLTRGGLWVITEDMQKVFIIAEKYFCVQTNAIGLREINIVKLVENLIKFPPLSLTFHNIVSDSNATVNEEVEINTLSSILTLYLRVHTFSLTKDIVTKKKRKIACDKALRKSIKQSSKNEETK